MSHKTGWDPPRTPSPMLRLPFQWPHKALSPADPETHKDAHQIFTRVEICLQLQNSIYTRTTLTRNDIPQTAHKPPCQRAFTTRMPFTRLNLRLSVWCCARRPNARSEMCERWLRRWANCTDLSHLSARAHDVDVENVFYTHIIWWLFDAFCGQVNALGW